jgi:hypothetical protein
MTEHSTEPRGDTTARTRPPSEPMPAMAAPAPTSGWVRFAGIVMVVVGVFGAVGLGTWAWIHLIVGAIVALTGTGLLSGDQPWARPVAMVIVGLSLLVQLVWLPAAPLWSILVIALDVTILVALAGASSGDRQQA